MSAKLSDVQRRWSAIELEAFGVISSLQFFDVMIYGHHVDMYTDHNPLKFIVVGTPKSSKLCRWSLALQRYDLTLHYKSGSTHLNADGLSRCLTSVTDSFD